MSRNALPWLLLGTLLAGACTTDLPADNPYDPDLPPQDQ